jgi:hypothetical protein
VLCFADDKSVVQVSPDVTDSFPKHRKVNRIDPQTGHVTQVAALKSLSAADFVAYVFDKDALYLLAHSNNSDTATLYRVQV